MRGEGGVDSVELPGEQREMPEGRGQGRGRGSEGGGWGRLRRTPWGTEGDA